MFGPFFATGTLHRPNQLGQSGEGRRSGEGPRHFGWRRFRVWRFLELQGFRVAGFSDSSML